MPGGLCVDLLNKGDGGKNVKLQHEHTGTVYNGVHYTLNYDKTNPDGTVTKVQKGTAHILRDRNDQPYYSAQRCAEILSTHHDFAEEPEWLEQVVFARGHNIIFLPKFHCELNYIEIIWAYTKSYLRRHCTFSFLALKADLPDVLLGVPLSAIRRFERHCLRYMSGYREHNLHGPLLDYIMKKYKSHRRIPDTCTQETIAEYEREMNIKWRKSSPRYTECLLYCPD